MSPRSMCSKKFACG